MKISSIELAVLESPYPYGMDSGSSDSRGPKYSIIIQVHTDEGITGISDCDSHPHVIKALIDAPRYISNFSEGLKYAVIGENPFEYEKIWSNMYQSAFYQGRRGAAIHAMSAIDIAIWDIIGKATGNPLSTTLGANRHERIKAYASTLFRNSAEEMKDAVQKYRELGFKAVKFGWGIVTKQPDRLIPLIEAARIEAGNEMDIMVDGLWSEDVKLVIQLAKELEKYNIYFIEEPLVSDNLKGYKKLSQSVNTRIACGEQLGGLHEYRQLIQEADIDIIQPDISRAGGLTEVRKLVTLAEQEGKLLIPHAWTSDILTAVSLHLNSYQSHPVFQEFCTNDTPLSRDLVCNPLRLEKDGTLKVPAGLGIGVELNKEAVKKYTIESLTI